MRIVVHYSNKMQILLSFNKQLKMKYINKLTFKRKIFLVKEETKIKNN